VRNSILAGLSFAASAFQLQHSQAVTRRRPPVGIVVAKRAPIAEDREFRSDASRRSIASKCARASPAISKKNRVQGRRRGSAGRAALSHREGPVQGGGRTGAPACWSATRRRRPCRKSTCNAAAGTLMDKGKRHGRDRDRRARRIKQTQGSLISDQANLDTANINLRYNRHPVAHRRKSRQNQCHDRQCRRARQRARSR